MLDRLKKIYGLLPIQMEAISYMGPLFASHIFLF